MFSGFPCLITAQHGRNEAGKRQELSIFFQADHDVFLPVMGWPVTARVKEGAGPRARRQQREKRGDRHALAGMGGGRAKPLPQSTLSSPSTVFLYSV